jgi:hypothetical protein
LGLPAVRKVKPAGSGSWMVTLIAGVCPLLVTVIRYWTVPPAGTGFGDTDIVTLRSGEVGVAVAVPTFTSVTAVELLSVSLLSAMLLSGSTVAVLLMLPLSAVTATVTLKVTDAPVPNDGTEQVTFPFAKKQPADADTKLVLAGNGSSIVVPGDVPPVLLTTIVYVMLPPVFTEPGAVLVVTRFTGTGVGVFVLVGVFVAVLVRVGVFVFVAVLVATAVGGDPVTVGVRVAVAVGAGTTVDNPGTTQITLDNPTICVPSIGATM